MTRKVPTGLGDPFADEWERAQKWLIPWSRRHPYTAVSTVFAAV